MTKGVNAGQKKSSSIEIKPVDRILLIDQIIDIIKVQIAQGKINPGDKIPGERTLSEMFNVSRTSVRQALKALEVLGVLEIRHGSTTTLNKDISNLLINPLKFMSILYNVGISELFDTRRTIEVDLAKKAAIHATTEDLSMMRKCLEKMENNLDNPDVYLYSEKNFHEGIFAASRNRILTATIISLNKLLISSRQESIKLFRNLRDSLNEHLKIFRAIEKKDSELAGQAMLEHLADVEKRLNTIDLDYLNEKLSKSIIG
ncbi:MAG: FadR family transcriptional regulator [Treponema sp.]|nr:FadR family transcriptional regulator [Treponema sp.]